MNCRHCQTELKLSLVDLGMAPPSNAYLGANALDNPEIRFPLRVLVCEECWLVQTEDFTKREELFDPEYAYFSGYSTSWLAHCQSYVNEMVERFGLGREHLVVELAANDGYLLQYVKAAGVPCLGVEPTRATADAARAKGIPIVEEFFGLELAERLAAEGKEADLMVANNVLAHVPDINDFVAGIARLLKPEGVITLEFPHLLKLCEEVQFDTIYHEHYSYLSLTSVDTIFRSAGLKIVDVVELPTHGGSLRVFAQRTTAGSMPRSAGVDALLERERQRGMTTAEFYHSFQQETERVKDEFRRFILGLKERRKTVGAYGAAAKGNTLLNFAGISAEEIPFVADLNENKQGKFMPGSRIPIVDQQHLRETRPDYVVILPWNLRTEIVKQLAYVREWGGEFVTAIPSLQVF